jgi:glycosyltransferase involved in cell wall biosynthesis
MRILQIHNSYRLPGGEDVVAEAEAAILRNAGHEVLSLSGGNSGSRIAMMRIASQSDWSQSSFRRTAQICREFRPDVAHVHNFWMSLSPSVHAACHRQGVPTVQTLHNYRLMCANGVMLRNGQICDSCLGASPLRGVVHRCYRDSAAASALVARMILTNRIKKTWWNDVDAFIAITNAGADLFRRGRVLPAGRLYVKPHFTSDPGPAPQPPSACGDVVFVGRLSAEKGVNVLLEAWARSSPKGLARELIVTGDGPEAEKLRSIAQRSPHPVRFLGNVDPSEVTAIVRRARFCVVPSVWPEIFGLVVIQAFACGKPVLAFDIGGPGELVAHEQTGLKVPCGDVDRLAKEIDRLCSDDGLVDRLGAAARQDYLTRFTPEANIHELMKIYSSARSHFLARQARPAAGTRSLPGVRALFGNRTETLCSLTTTKNRSAVSCPGE